MLKSCFVLYKTSTPWCHGLLESQGLSSPQTNPNLFCLDLDSHSRTKLANAEQHARLQQKEEDTKIHVANVLPRSYNNPPSAVRSRGRAAELPAASLASVVHTNTCVSIHPLNNHLRNALLNNVHPQRQTQGFSGEKCAAFQTSIHSSPCPSALVR